MPEDGPSFINVRFAGDACCLAPDRRENADMALSLFDSIGVPFEQTTELERQVVATFAFGMVFAAGQAQQLSPPQVHALSVCVLIDAFGYSDHQAADFANHLIAVSSDATLQPVMNAIIHRGIDGHRQWQSKDSEGLRSNLTDVVNRVRASE
jgi:hypothetical protein